MKAKEVLRRYAAGERNFCNTNLCGTNFKGKDLSGSDFSGADIRGANFNNATMHQVNFTQSQAGLPQTWIIVQIFLKIVLIASVVISQTFSGVLAVSLLSGTIYDSIVGYVYLFFVLVLCLAVLLQGLTIRAIGSIVTALIISGTSIVFSGLLVEIITSVALSKTIVASTGTVVLAGIFAVLFEGIVTSAGTTAAVAAGAGAAAGIFGSLFSVIPVAAIVVVVAATGIFSIGYATWRFLEKDSRFNTAQIFWLALTALGGTSFCGADLTDTVFSKTCLSHTSFADSKQRQTNITHVYWQGATGLDSARLGSSILQDSRVRDILTARKKNNEQNLANANFRGANLSRVSLEKAILKRAIFSDALLRGTVLKDSILTEAQAIGADFTEACLTGATIESWNIDSTTIFEDIDCDYVFLSAHRDEKGNRERRPHDPDKVFQPGDFEKVFKEVQDDVQLLIRDGVNPVALRSAFRHIRETYPNLSEDAFRGFQRRNNDFVVMVKVPQSIDKGQFEHNWDSGYQAGLQAGREESAALLASAEKRADGLEMIALTIAQTPSTQNTTNDYRQTIEVKGNVADSVIGQGDRNHLTNQPGPKTDTAS